MRAYKTLNWYHKFEWEGSNKFSIVYLNHVPYMNACLSLTPDEAITSAKVNLKNEPLNAYERVSFKVD